LRSPVAFLGQRIIVIPEKAVLKETNKSKY
jgi:hypothetical protein